MMGAKLLMTPREVARHPEVWLKRRRRTPAGRWCVTASEIPLVCGIAPPSWGGPFSLYHAKLDGKDIRDSAELRRGRAVEPIVLEEFAEEYPGLALLPGGLYASGEDDRWLATFDGQAAEYAAIEAAGLLRGPVLSKTGAADLAARGHPGVDVFTVQVKTSIPQRDWGWEEDSGLVPDHIRAQVLWEAMVRGAGLAIVACKFMATWTTRYYPIVVDDAARAEIAWMVDEAERFCKRLETLDEPPVDWFPETTSTLRRMYPGIEDRAAQIPAGLARRYKAALKASALADQRKAQAVNEMLARAGEAGTIVFTDPATGRQVRVATRTAGPTRGYTVEPKDRVERLNACGWAQFRRPRKPLGGQP